MKPKVKYLHADYYSVNSHNQNESQSPFIRKVKINKPPHRILLVVFPGRGSHKNSALICPSFSITSTHIRETLQRQDTAKNKLSTNYSVGTLYAHVRVSG